MRKGEIKMNKYMMAIRHYFRGYECFEVKALNKEDAIEKAKEYVKNEPRFSCGGNYKLNDIKCIKKLKT